MFFNFVMNVCDFVIDTLYNNGINTYFVVTGGSIVPFIDAVSRNNKVTYFVFSTNSPLRWRLKDTSRVLGKLLRCV